MFSTGCRAATTLVLMALGCTSTNDNPGAATSGTGGSSGGASAQQLSDEGGATSEQNTSRTGGAPATSRATSSGGSGPFTSATGGRTAAGGAPNTANGGSTITSSASSGGNVTTTPASGTSPGCGSGKTTSPCSKSGTTCSLEVNNKDRTYYLQLPANYNASKPYPVVFQFHPLTGTAEMALTEYNISKGMPDAIYITPQGLKKFEQFLNKEATGWGNVDGEDIQFTQDMLKAAQTDYCVDSERVFSVGFSYGGMMSYAIGCELGGIFRAIAPMSGATVSGCKLSGKPVAMWGAHGKSDSVVGLSQGQQARDKILKQNNCGTETKPVDPSPCVEYQGCTSSYPVVWCEWDGDHATPSFSASAIATFFKQF